VALCDSLKHRLLWISAAFQGRKTDLAKGLNLLLTLILFEIFEHLNFGFVSDFDIRISSFPAFLFGSGYAGLGT
jgi:hypothetical protein